MSKAIIIYGPPGAGKGTQANLLAARTGFIHLDTGRFLESLVYDPANRRNAILRRERRLFESGMLMTPSFVFREIAKRVRQIAQSGSGLILSGSPRTQFEAFGTGKPKQHRLVAVLEKLYGKKQVHYVLLNVRPQSSMKRNANRLVCSFCGTPSLVLYADTKCLPKACLLCGAPLRKRTLDTPEVIKKRLAEYKNRTAPIFEGLRARGYTIHKIDGEPAPYKVAQAIARKLKLTNDTN